MNLDFKLPSFVLGPLCPFMCLPVSRLFWVSSLAYPNLLGTKGYVVVVVVVVDFKLRSQLSLQDSMFTLSQYTSYINSENVE
jgi:hypothetical protein